MQEEKKPIGISGQITYIRASENPLSSDVILIEGQEYLYVFDVGNNEAVAEYLNNIPKKKRVILSHFHKDHMGNIGRIAWDSVYFGANTEKYFRYYIPEEEEKKEPRYVAVSGPVKISDGVTIEIYPVPNSHAKGALLLQVNGEYIFIGDSLYSKEDGGDFVYNAQLLKEELRLLNELSGTQIFSSHEKRPLKDKKAVLRFLEQIYAKREKNEALIKTGKKKETR